MTERHPDDSSLRIMTWLLVVLLCLLLLGAGLLYELIRNNPKYLTQKSFSNTFFSNINTMSVSGDMYVESLKTGELYGVQFDGGVAWDGRMDVRLTSRMLPADSTAKIIRTDTNKPVYGSISGVSDITQMFVVGASSQDIAMYNLLNKHKKQVDGTWYSFADASLAGRLQSLGVPGLLPQGLSASERAQLADVYEQYPFLVVDEMYRGEILLQKPTVQYEVHVDQAVFVQFANELSRQNQSLMSAQASQRIQDALNHMQTLQIWINPKSQLVEQVYAVYTDKDMRYSMRVRLQNTAVKVSPSEPANAKPITEFIKLMGLGG